MTLTSHLELLSNGDMDETEYRSHAAISHSLLKEFGKSPAHFRFAVDNPVAETEAMLRGTLIHCMALEPQELHARFVRATDCDRRTKAGKEQWAKLQEESVGKRLIPAGMWDLAERCVSSLERDIETAMWLDEARSGQIEKPLFWQRQSVDCKGRPDSVLDDGTVIDIKTTQNCYPAFFSAELFRRSYHTQGAFYRSGLLAAGGKWRSHVLVCVETEAPYAVAVFRLNIDVIGDADGKIAEWIDQYRRCRELDQWPGYGLTEVQTPRWAMVEAR
jgi:hypothetical protein